MQQSIDCKSHQALYNGQPTDSPVLTRAFSFGDGCFTTIRFQNDYILLEKHLDRLERDCRALKIPPIGRACLQRELAAIKNQLPESAIVRITISRGFKKRGYQFDPQEKPERLVQWFPYTAPTKPVKVHGWISDYRLSAQPELCGIKHLNRLDQVLASASIAKGKEAILLDQQGNLIEALSSNIFWRINDQWFTPKLTDCGVHGVIRQWLIEQLQNKIELVTAKPDVLFQADEVIICNGVQGIRRLESLNDNNLADGSDYQHLQRKLMNE